ncbi:uncharacterized protein LOC143212214 isoform X2 [Lasioglossum baleicum]|uniref:uncharacterized protein LOC143212214 isoform X2 n=1 Tax=Lasioglossum baleicum TaxID=434251 RepID=UPI003FCED1C3
MAYNFPGVPTAAMPPMGMGPMGPLAPIAGPQSFMELASQGFPPLPPPIPLPGMNDSPLEFSTNKNQPPLARESSDDNNDKRTEKNDIRRERENRDGRDNRDNRRSRSERSDRRERDRERREERNDRDRREERRPEERSSINSSTSNNSSHNNNSNGNELPPTSNASGTANLGAQMEQATGVWGMGVGYPVMGMGPMGPMGPMMSEMTLGPHMGHTHSYGPMSMGMMSHDGSMIGAQILGPEQIMSDAAQIMSGALPPQPSATQGTKEIIHCKSCTLFPPNPNAPPPTTRERPPGCRTIFVGGLPENITETIIQEIFERCGEITTLRLSKKNFCHIRFVLESSVDAAIYLSGYRVRIGSSGDSVNTGRLHVDFAQARDDQYEWECRQRQLQREQRHRERVEQERQRAPSSPPPVVHYTDHEASNICEKIKQDDTFMKAVQVVVTWLERGDCTKRNANTFYSMIQSTNSHVRRLLTEKVAYEEELQKAKELMKGRMQGLLIQFSQIERVFTAASHKKVWDHFTKAQRKNIEMWKKQSSTTTRSVKIDHGQSICATLNRSQKRDKAFISCIRAISPNSGRSRAFCKFVYFSEIIKVSGVLSERVDNGFSNLVRHTRFLCTIGLVNIFGLSECKKGNGRVEFLPLESRFCTNGYNCPERTGNRTNQLLIQILVRSSNDSDHGCRMFAARPRNERKSTSLICSVPVPIRTGRHSQDTIVLEATPELFSFSYAFVLSFFFLSLSFFLPLSLLFFLFNKICFS